MKLYGEWEVALPDGERHKWRPDDVTPGEEVLILGEWGTGGDYDEWVEKIDARDGAACQVLIWFLRRLDGRQEDRFGVVFPHRRMATVALSPPEAPASSTDPDGPSGDATSSRSSTGSGSGPGTGPV